MGSDLTSVTEENWAARLREIQDNPGGVFLPTLVQRGTTPVYTILEAARHYWKVVGEHEEANVQAALSAVEAGGALLTTADGYRRSVVALRTV